MTSLDSSISRVASLCSKTPNNCKALVSTKIKVASQATQRNVEFVKLRRDSSLVAQKEGGSNPIYVVVVVVNKPASVFFFYVGT